MASLYAPAITNEELLQQKHLRHRKINLNYEYISGFDYVDPSIFKKISWKSVDFTKANIAGLRQVQGIYMFTFNPSSFSRLSFDTETVFYIGQTVNLRERLLKYFRYPYAKGASDQERRFMILFFGDYLKLNYYETGNLSPAQLDELEHSLIDTIIPPFNIQFYSQITKQYRRLIQA